MEAETENRLDFEKVKNTFNVIEEWLNDLDFDDDDDDAEFKEDFCDVDF